MMSRHTVAEPHAPAHHEELKVQIRWMIRRDMNEVLRIEQDSFDFEWTEEDFLSCLRQRNCIGMVAENNDRVIGFMVYELHKNRLHILNFAVAPRFRHLTIGAQMVEKLVNKLSQQRRQEITLEIRETNLAAQLFFAKQGFKAEGTLRHHYDDSGEDAYIMRFCLPGAEGSGYIPTNRISRYYESMSDASSNQYRPDDERGDEGKGTKVPA